MISTLFEVMWELLVVFALANLPFSSSLSTCTRTGAGPAMLCNPL